MTTNLALDSLPAVKKMRTWVTRDKIAYYPSELRICLNLKKEEVYWTCNRRRTVHRSLPQDDKMSGSSHTPRGSQMLEPSFLSVAGEQGRWGWGWSSCCQSWRDQLSLKLGPCSCLELRLESKLAQGLPAALASLLWLLLALLSHRAVASGFYYNKENPPPGSWSYTSQSCHPGPLEAKPAWKLITFNTFFAFALTNFTWA